MDEQFLKRNTDCVYFLASPLTCKKGIECEFRHNEIARLNPRDCWYWLSGNCLNPTCAFRHPPLDAGMPSEPTQSSLPANKTMVPCYFFFNGVCNKGERCSFLHGPDDSVPTVKPVKNACGSTDTLIPENNTSSGNKTVVASVPSQTSYETVAKTPLKFDFQSKEDLKQSVPKNIEQQSASPQIPPFEYKEVAAVTGLDTLFPAEGFVHKMSHSNAEQSSGEQVSNHREPEERLESSPGFDVLVDVEPEILDYEDDTECLPVLDGEGRELNGQYLGYEFKDPDQYDPMCTDAEILYEEDERYDDCRFLDIEHTLANDRKLPCYSREIFLNSILSRTRVHMPTEMAMRGRNMDLRDHLRRRRENNRQLVSSFLRRHESPRLFVQNQERHQRRCIEQQRSRRLASEVGLSTITSIREGENLSISDKHFFRNSQQHNRSRKHYGEKLAKRQFHSSDVPRKQVSKERRLTHASPTFTGPKTLAQIKEEKKKYEENVSFKSSSSDFQDPKPLSEILKDKRMLDCVGDGNSCNN